MLYQYTLFLFKNHIKVNGEKFLARNEALALIFQSPPANQSLECLIFF
jgi:hypothetical protein